MNKVENLCKEKERLYVLIDSMKSILIFLVLMMSFGLISSCGEPKTPIDARCILTPTEVKTILNDLFLYEAAVKTKALDSLLKANKREHIYQSLFKKHQTTRADFEESLECYTLNKALIPILEDLKTEYKSEVSQPDTTKHERQYNFSRRNKRN